MDGYPLVMTNSLLLNMTIEIVDFPINNMVTFNSYVPHYQRVFCNTVSETVNRKTTVTFQQTGSYMNVQ